MAKLGCSSLGFMFCERIKTCLTELFFVLFLKLKMFLKHTKDKVNALKVLSIVKPIYFCPKLNHAG